MRLLEVSIGVENVEKSLELYKKLLPHTSVISWSNGEANGLVLEDGTALGIWDKKHVGSLGGRGGLNVHFGFEIKNEEHDHYWNLIESLGFTPIPYNRSNGQRSIYFQDYDGNQVEFMVGDWLVP